MNFKLQKKLNQERVFCLLNDKSYHITGLNRPLGLQENEATRISKLPAHEDGKIVSPSHRPPLPPRSNFCSLLLESESNPGS
jgi:hypothetical protein